MIWLVLEALADPDHYAIRIDRNGDIHIEEIAVLNAQGARVITPRRIA